MTASKAPVGSRDFMVHLRICRDTRRHADHGANDEKSAPFNPSGLRQGRPTPHTIERPPVGQVNLFSRDFFGEAGVWGIARRHLAASAAFAVLVTLTGPAAAQGRQPASGQDEVFIGIPEY